MIRIRAARPEDAREIARVHVDAWRVGYAGLLPDEYLRRLRSDDRAASYRFDGDGHETLVAVEGTTVRGFIHVGYSRDAPEPADSVDEGEVSALYISPESWRRGVGRALMAAGRAWMAERGYTRARLWVLAGNERAESFYRADGWGRQDQARSETVWGIRVEEVLYTRRLP